MWTNQMDAMHVNELALFVQDWILHFKEGLWFDEHEKFRHDPSKITLPALEYTWNQQ